MVSEKNLVINAHNVTDIRTFPTYWHIYLPVMYFINIILVHQGKFHKIKYKLTTVTYIRKEKTKLIERDKQLIK